MSKFELFSDLGTLVVPDNYEHVNSLSYFREANYKSFRYFDDEINDDFFSNPTQVLKPGENWQIKVFAQAAGNRISLTEGLAFLHSQGSVFTGAQGAALVFQQKYGLLPRGKQYNSLDTEDRLPKCEGDCLVPWVSAYLGPVFEFSFTDMGHYASDQEHYLFYDEDVFLGFFRKT